MPNEKLREIINNLLMEVARFLINVIDIAKEALGKIGGGK